MKVFLLMGALFFLFLGINSIVQYKEYTAAKNNGQPVMVVVKHKYTSRHNGRELLVVYQQSEYWVRVAAPTFDSASFNNAMLLVYDPATDTMIDDTQPARPIFPGFLMIAAAIYFCWLSLKSR